MQVGLRERLDKSLAEKDCADRPVLAEGQQELCEGGIVQRTVSAQDQLLQAGVIGREPFGEGRRGAQPGWFRQGGAMAIPEFHVAGPVLITFNFDPPHLRPDRVSAAVADWAVMWREKTTSDMSRREVPVICEIGVYCGIVPLIGLALRNVVA